MEPRRIVFVVFDDFQVLDLTGPHEVFHTAVRQLRESSDIGDAERPGSGRDAPAYELVTVSPTGGSARSSSGLDLGATSLAKAARPGEAGRADGGDGTDVDTLVVVGGIGVAEAAASAEFRDALTSLAGRARRITSVCTGALALARAGLLDGYAATTHWAYCDELATRHPLVAVHPDRIYVRDRDRWTSAGVTAGIDLALALVEDDHGSDLAHQVARRLVVFTRRPGGQTQFSAQMRSQRARRDPLRDLQDWLPDNLDADLTVAAMADRAGMSERTFARAFHAEIGATPAAHVEQLRVEAARRLLEGTDASVATVARRVGFTSAEVLHRAFRRRLGTTPNRYRQHFASAPA